MSEPVFDKNGWCRRAHGILACRHACQGRSEGCTRSNQTSGNGGVSAATHIARTSWTRVAPCIWDDACRSAGRLLSGLAATVKRCGWGFEFALNRPGSAAPAKMALSAWSGLEARTYSKLCATAWRPLPDGPEPRE